MILFHFIFRKKKKGKKEKHALAAEDSWSAWDMGRYFFLPDLGTKQMGGQLIISGAIDGAFQLLAT